MMAKRKRSSLKFIDFRYLRKKSMMSRGLEKTRARKKRQLKIVSGNMKRAGGDIGPVLSKKRVHRDPKQKNQPTVNCENLTPDASQAGRSVPQTADSLVPALTDWEVDSGFCSEASPPASGRSSPSVSYQTTVVALDCEMVGSGPGGYCDELARCSIVDYHGNVLFDEYVRPRQLVTDYRTQWSGIQRHHLLHAMPFAQARDEVLRILEGKVVVGHSIQSDFKVLDMIHPCHMVRDTSSACILRQLAGFDPRRCLSLKILAHKLLNRRIQVGNTGHCSVEDARATLDLYKLVEAEWERELRDDDTPLRPSFAASDHYMQDEYWPDDVTADGHDRRVFM